MLHHPIDGSQPRQRSLLAEELRFYLFHQRRGGRHQNRLFQPAAMFGLTEQVGGNEGGIGSFVGNHQNLGGAGDHIDGNFAVEQPLCGGDVGVAGADDLLHLADAFRAAGERGDTVDAAEAVDFGHAGKFHRVENCRMHRPVPPGRSDGNDLLHPRGGGDSGGVDHRGNQGRGAARNVDADPVERFKFLPERDAGADLRLPVARHGPFREGAHLRERRADRPTLCRSERLLRLLDLRLVDPEAVRRQGDVVELLGKTDQRGVSVRPDLIDDSSGLFPDLRRKGGPFIERPQVLLKIGGIKPDFLHFFT